MSKFDTLQGKALEMAGQVGSGVRHVIPDNAGKWLQAGVVLGAARSGAKAAGGMVRRNPALTAAVALAAGTGLLLYAMRRRKQKANGKAARATIEGRSRRVDADRAASRPRKTANRRAQKSADAETGAGG